MAKTKEIKPMTIDESGYFFGAGNTFTDTKGKSKTTSEKTTAKKPKK